MKKQKWKDGPRGRFALAASELQRDKRQLAGSSIMSRRQSRKVWLTAIRAGGELAVRIAHAPNWESGRSQLTPLIEQFTCWACVCKDAVPDYDAFLAPLRKLVEASDSAVVKDCVARLDSMLGRIDAELADTR